MYKLLVILITANLVIRNCCASKRDIWLEYKKQFNKHYNFHEEQQKKQIFFENLQKISKHNERFKNGLEKFEMKLDQFSDIKDDEFVKTMTVNLLEDPKLFKIHSKNITLRGPLPKYVNWVERGFNTSVPYQGPCGSCYAFGSAAALEAQYYIKHKTHIKISEQDAVDCSRFYGNWGCKGGWPANVFEYAKSQGISLYEDKPYQGEEDFCFRFRFRNTPLMRIRTYYRVQNSDENELKKIVATNGPVTVAIDASLSTFHRYGGGIYYDPECSPRKFTHIVLVVGYGTENNEDYWLIKNSWGIHWGINGYAKMARNRNNHCGIATHAVYPILQ